LYFFASVRRADHRDLPSFPTRRSSDLRRPPNRPCRASAATASARFPGDPAAVRAAAAPRPHRTAPRAAALVADASRRSGSLLTNSLGGPPGLSSTTPCQADEGRRAILLIPRRAAGR